VQWKTHGSAVGTQCKRYVAETHSNCLTGADTEWNVDNYHSFLKMHHGRFRTDAYKIAIAKQPILNTQKEQSLCETNEV
jgi:hypothetical protein